MDVADPRLSTRPILLALIVKIEASTPLDAADADVLLKVLRVIIEDRDYKRHWDTAELPADMSNPPPAEGDPADEELPI